MSGEATRNSDAGDIPVGSSPAGRPPARTTVLLDAGGVLLDESEHEKRICTLVVDLVRTVSSNYSNEDYWRDTDEAISRFCPSTPRCVLWKRCDGDRDRYEMWADQYRHAASRRLPVRLYDAMRHEIPHLAEQFRLVMAGQYGPEVYDELARHGLDGCFANRLSQKDFGLTKPDPRYVARVAAAAGVDPEECVMVGDRIDKDVIPAKQNGMGTVFLRTGIYRNQKPRTPEEAPDLVLDGCAGLADAVIGRWGGRPEDHERRSFDV